MINEKGKWLVKGKVKALKEPSNEYLDSKSAEELEQEVESQKQEILTELSQLDKTITRPLEEYFESVNYTPHSKVIEVVNRKKQLREQLKNLEV